MFKPRLKQEVSTRFESYYNLLNSISINRTELEACEDQNILNHVKPINFYLLGKVLNIVEIFEQSRLRLGVQNRCTSHLVYGVYLIIKANLNKFKSENEEDDNLDKKEKEEISKLIETFLTELDTCYLKRVHINHKVASLLSPQFFDLVKDEKDVVDH